MIYRVEAATFACLPAGELDTTRAQGQAAETRAQISPLEEAGQRAIHRLGVLLGQGPPKRRHNST